MKIEEGFSEECSGSDKELKNTIRIALRESDPLKLPYKAEVIEWHSFNKRHILNAEGITQEAVDKGHHETGPTIANFTNKRLADEYVAFKRKQVEDGNFLSHYED